MVHNTTAVVILSIVTCRPRILTLFLFKPLVFSTSVGRLIGYRIKSGRLFVVCVDGKIVGRLGGCSGDLQVDVS